MGRIDTISEIGMHMICTAEASSVVYQQPLPLAVKTVSPVVGFGQRSSVCQ